VVNADDLHGEGHFDGSSSGGADDFASVNDFTDSDDDDDDDAGMYGSPAPGRRLKDSNPKFSESAPQLVGVKSASARNIKPRQPGERSKTFVSERISPAMQRQQPPPPQPAFPAGVMGRQQQPHTSDPQLGSAHPAQHGSAFPASPFATHRPDHPPQQPLQYMGNLGDPGFANPAIQQLTAALAVATQSTHRGSIYDNPTVLAAAAAAIAASQLQAAERNMQAFSSRTLNNNNNNVNPYGAGGGPPVPGSEGGFLATLRKPLEISYQAQDILKELTAAAAAGGGAVQMPVPNLLTSQQSSTDMLLSKGGGTSGSSTPGDTGSLTRNRDPISITFTNLVSWPVDNMQDAGIQPNSSRVFTVTVVDGSFQKKVGCGNDALGSELLRLVEERLGVQPNGYFGLAMPTSANVADLPPDARDVDPPGTCSSLFPSTLIPC
jgi:hypothetical protein